MNIILGYILTFGYVFLIIGLSNIIKKKTNKAELSRKFVHIFVSFSWVIMYLYFGNTFHLLVPPIAFTILNFVSYKKNIFGSIERTVKDTLGTVFYPISMLICSVLSLIDDKFLIPYGIGLFSMAFGDGIAAIVGLNFKSAKLINKKSLLGSATVFILVFLTVLFMNYIFILGFQLYKVLIISFAGTIIELVSKKGYDNIFLPIGICLLSYMFL